MATEFRIPSFQSGINQYNAEGLIKVYEAVDAYNCDITDGALRSSKAPLTILRINDSVDSLIPFYGDGGQYLMYSSNGNIKTIEVEKNTVIVNNNKSDRYDSLNFEYNGKKIVVITNGVDDVFYWDGKDRHLLLNRRPHYDDNGKLDYYVDANGNHIKDENAITTLAPKGKFIELHYDRLWIAGDPNNPDRVYFSTNGVNGADINDWTVPLADEEEINMHGGFIDVRSYDGSGIIGMKVVMNYVTIFKSHSAYKVYGSTQENYEMVQIFSSEGAIGDRTICTGNNGLYFLNRDGIYYYDGTNTTLVSSKLNKIFERMNYDYAELSVGLYSNNRYYLSFPIDGSDINNILVVYNTLTGAYMVYNIEGIKDMVEFDNEVYYSKDNGIYKLFGAINVMPLKWTTPMYDFGYKNTRKISDRIYFRGKGTGKVKFTLKTERMEKTLEVELTPEETLYRKRLKGKGRMLQLTIENVNQSNIEIIAPALTVELDED